MRFIQRGFTLIELIVVMAIVAAIASASIPMLKDYSINSRLREGGSLLLTDALFAQNQALKRQPDPRVGLSISATTVTVTDLNSGEQLRQRDLPKGVTATPVNVIFASMGRLTPFGTGSEVELSIDDSTCSDEYRCPKLIIDGGGGVSVCGNKLKCN